MSGRVRAIAPVLLFSLTALAFGAPYRVTDTLGRSIGFTAVPQRIVIAAKASLLLVDAVYLFPGAAARVVAVGTTDQGLGDFFPFLDPGAAGKTRFANNVGPEQIVTAKPDLVILKSYMKEKLGDNIEKLGIPVLYLDLESTDSFYADIATLGALFQQPERARAVRDWYSSRVDAVRKATLGAARPGTLIVQYSAKDGANAFSVPPAGWIQSTIAEAAGGAISWKDAGPGDGWKKIGLEQLAAWDPRYVFVVSYQKPSAAIARDLRASSLLGGTILGFPSDFSSWDQADSRWILGLEWAAVTLHPDFFPGLDIRKEARAFYSELYGVDDAVITREILPRLDSALAKP